MAVSGTMGRFDLSTPSNESSGQNVVNGSSFDYDKYECFIVKGNATPATCFNRTISGRYPQMDYYYYADDDAGWDFIDIYYSKTRFAVETTMAFLSMTLNVLEDKSNCQDFLPARPDL